MAAAGRNPRRFRYEMAEAKHTPGRLKVNPYTGWIVTEGDPYGHGSMHVADVRGWGHLTGVGACNLDEETAYAIQQANAQRIVATWNACEGIPTELLETSGVIPIRDAQKAVWELWNVVWQVLRDPDGSHTTHFASASLIKEKAIEIKDKLATPRGDTE